MKRWVAILLAGVSLSVAAQQWLDRQQRIPLTIEEVLYLNSGETLRRASVGFDGLLGDVYWMRTVLYFGEKFNDQREQGEVFDVTKLRLLAPMLNIVTDLDPRHVSAYRFGGFFLQQQDAQEAVRFLERGIRNNPNEWRLYQDLGLAHWRQARFREASDAYLRGSQLAHAPRWMGTMAATMMAKGGDREIAREMFLRLYTESNDEFIKQVCLEQLQLLQSPTP